MSVASPQTHQLGNRDDSATPSSNSALLWSVFFGCAVATIALFFVPAFIIRPFSHQAPRALLLAMDLRQRAPLGTLIAAVFSFVLAFVVWRSARRWGKVLLTITMVLVAFSAVMARMNYFEWMFHPIAGPRFIAQADSKLDAKEMILAVREGEDARAYPISQMAYHHILNDVAGGVPIAVTY
jgi:amino acid transporter